MNYINELKMINSSKSICKNYWFSQIQIQTFAYNYCHCILFNKTLDL